METYIIVTGFFLTNITCTNDWYKDPSSKSNQHEKLEAWQAYTWDHTLLMCSSDKFMELSQ